MFTYKSTQFHVLGFILCLLASFSSGLRWTMAQVIMQKSKLGLRNPIDMIYYMQPWMLLPVIPITLWFEGNNKTFTTNYELCIFFLFFYECEYYLNIILIFEFLTKSFFTKWDFRIFKVSYIIKKFDRAFHFRSRNV